MTSRRPYSHHSSKVVPCRTARGFSMTEMVWVVSILGILAALAMSNVGDIVKGSKETVAGQTVEMLNSGLAAYAQASKEIELPPSADGSSEVIVLHNLQGRSTLNPLPGSPFVSPHYRPAISGDTADYRLKWMGTQYTLLTPGQSGTGLKVPFDGTDLGPAWIQPPDWNPYGE